uniref:50S ribosomal protein L6 n=1 Tax=Lygus hesperus TaxID=30085 RepID=A0A0A9YT66_LYGHE
MYGSNTGRTAGCSSGYPHRIVCSVPHGSEKVVQEDGTGRSFNGCDGHDKFFGNAVDKQVSWRTQSPLGIVGVQVSVLTNGCDLGIEFQRTFALMIWRIGVTSAVESVGVKCAW